MLNPETKKITKTELKNMIISRLERGELTQIGGEGFSWYVMLDENDMKKTERTRADIAKSIAESISYNHTCGLEGLYIEDFISWYLVISKNGVTYRGNEINFLV